jgi:hypothetical protein
MPRPRQNETKSEFLTRCVPFVLEEGTAKNQEQAVAICHSLWEQSKDGKDSK